METPNSHVELYDEPRSITADGVLREPVTALLVAGIVNPYGPTLSAAVVAGDPKTRAKLPLIQLMLNPFRQEMKAIGKIAIGPRWEPSLVIRQLFDFT